MRWLSAPTLERLRDQLQARGQRPSLVLPTANLSPNALEFVHVTSQYGLLSEAMYLMMSADGRVTQEEREVLKGALRTLSNDTVHGVHIEAMIDSAARRMAADGRAKRTEAVLKELRSDPTDAEVAFVLMAAIAMADVLIADAENELLNTLAEGLGISTEHANRLLDQVEHDRNPTSS